MPKFQYKGSTVSDHWVRSPVLNVRNACFGCHRKHDPKVTEKELKDRVEQIQDRHWLLRQQAMKSKFDVADGFESLPRAFLRLLTSENIGKQMVKVAEEPT